MSSPSGKPDFWLEVPVARSFLVSCSQCRFNDPRNYYWRPEKRQQHEGIDLAATDSDGQPVAILAAQRGIVDKVGYNARGYGNYVRLLHRWHNGTYVTWYAHLSSVNVEKGDFVNAGDQIGVAGTSGYTWGKPHLHLTLQKIGAGLSGYVINDVIDPEPLFVFTDPPAFHELSFVEDVTILDGTRMEPGRSFVKTWRVRNSGNQRWKRGFKLVFVEGDQMGAPDSIPLPTAKPGEVVELSVTFTTPDHAGRYQSVWQAQDADGEKFDYALYTEVEVAQSIAYDEAVPVADVTIPKGSIIQPGDYFLKTWRVRNVGTTVWKQGYRLGFFSGDRLEGPDSVPLPAAAPGQEVQVSATLQAPEVGGVYRSVWRPLDPDGRFFDHEQIVEIEVPSPIPISNRLDEARYVSDVTIPDGTPVQAGQKFAKTWRMRNSGTTTWGPGYELAFYRDEPMGEAESVPLPAAEPGETVDVSVPLIAPNSPGEYRSTWRPRNADGDYFDFAMFTEIVVPKAVPPSKQLDELSYVRDVTIADGAAVQPGQTFTKTWRIKNTGTTTWDSGYELAFYADKRMNGPSAVSLPAALPGAITEVSVQLTAPTAPGTYRSSWRPRNKNGIFFDHTIFAEIIVTPVGESDLEENAGLLEHVTVPPGATLRAGETFVKTWRVANLGNKEWSRGYTLAFSGGARLDGPESVSLSGQPGARGTNVSVALTAPSIPGRYQAVWRPRNPSGEPFGEALRLAIEVVDGAGVVDILPYLCGDGRIYPVRYTWDKSGEHLFQTQRAEGGQGSAFYEVRDQAWIEMWYDDEHIYRSVDTTGDDKVLLYGERGQTGCRWLPRLLPVGTRFRRRPTITVRRKRDCLFVNTFVQDSWMHFQALHERMRLPTGLEVQDVAEFAIYASVNGNPAAEPFEHQLYAKGIGLVASRGPAGLMVMTGPPRVPVGNELYREPVSCQP